MNSNEQKYSEFALCREMLETPEIIRNFSPESVSPLIEKLSGVSRILLTGEGSSRIFPAKRAITENNRSKQVLPLFSEGASQALEYNLAGSAAIGVSNSGKTKELIRLFEHVKKRNKSIPLLGVSAGKKTPLAELSDGYYHLSCGSEDAVAATKSVVEQALIYYALFSAMRDEPVGDFLLLADQFAEALALEVDHSIIEKLAASPKVYFAGRNDGVAEELALKMNEITRKSSAYLEGTYALHGIEEVMSPEEVIVLIDPFVSEFDMYQKHLAEGVGMTVIAVSSKDTPFPTVRIPDNEEFKEFLQLGAGWNLLVKIGLHLGIAMDTPVRARKVGNSI